MELEREREESMPRAAEQGGLTRRVWGCTQQRRACSEVQREKARLAIPGLKWKEESFSVVTVVILPSCVMKIKRKIALGVIFVLH